MILDLVYQMHKNKQPLAYSVVRREHPALVSAAEARFGSWGMTLRAKGINPNLHFIHHTPRKPKSQS